MATVTALELLNRVMQYRRQPLVSAYQDTNPEHVATLNALNMAKEDVLGARRWEFDLRHDGQIVTKASTAGRDVLSTLTTTSGSSAGDLVLPGLTASDELVGNWVARVVPTGSTSFSDTAFRIQSALSSVDTAAVSFPFAVPESNSAITCDVIWGEYLLPDTVREVVRASYEQNELRLDQASPTASFDELVPSLSWESGAPRMLSVGGFDIGTYDSSGAAPVPLLRAVVWPIPDDEYVVTYSYYYAHPDFEDGDSTLDGVPSSIVNGIVWKALSFMGMAWDNNFAAAHFDDMATIQINMQHAVYGGSRARRHTVRSWDSGGGGQSLAAGFPNKLIGDV